MRLFLGRRGEQLRLWPLHHQQGDHRPRSRPHSPAPGHLRRPLLFFLFACSAYITQTTFFKINFVLNFNFFHCLIFFFIRRFSNSGQFTPPKSRSLEKSISEERSFKY
ncbi:unnamed protein product [Oikopleura dioica]|uniref:Uncharacterized protein n=1 Tax=Oikopleura dioica TaxID=34765 RepID=E4X482_OIKDI|nr:unnamed protein product [Oikopleura dioica]